jgi:choline dehydrogenase-like flavoprotein
MIVEDYQRAAAINYDCCLIGAGAMGIAIALRLSEAGKSVLLLEAGGEEITKKNQDYCRCEVHGRDHAGSSDGRFRVLGGSTERWGGQAMRFDPADLLPRLGIHESGWPIHFDKLDNYYRQAEEFMGVSNAPYEEFSDDFDRTLDKVGGPKKPSSSNFSDFKIHYSVFTHEPRIREIYREKMLRSKFLSLWKNAAAIKLNTDDYGAIKSLIVHSSGSNYQITASHFVLASGGVENARFLLVQRDVFGLQELAKLDAIGRFFQDHPGAHVAELNGRGAALIQELFRLKKTSAMNLKGRLSWSEDKRLRSGLLAVSGTFLMMRKHSEFDTHSTGVGPRIGSFQEWIATIKSAARGKLYSPLHHTYLAVSAEDIRSPESRITLSDGHTDSAGTPRARIEWKIDKRVAESISTYVDTIDASLKRQGLGTLRKFHFMTELDRLTNVLKDNSHHIGSTGMGFSPQDAVVDSNSRVFGFSNLWIAGTSVLPTGSHANPTLTAIALALILADRLTFS